MAALFGPEPKERINLAIVHSNDTEIFSNYLQTLISCSDDEDGKIVGVEDNTISSVVWTEKQYTDQKPTVTNVDHYLFVGLGELMAKETYGIKSKYDQFNMSYGWLGTKAFLRVSSRTLSKKERNEFLSFAEEYEPGITKDFAEEIHTQMTAPSKYGKPGTLKTVSKNLPLAGPVISSHYVIKDALKIIQYRFLTRVFYYNAIDLFMKQ